MISRSAIACGVLLVGISIVTCAYAASDTRNSLVAVQVLPEIPNEELANMRGGACETGCEVESNHCSIAAPPGGYGPGGCNAATGGSPCAICDGDSQPEKCANWGYCISWLNTCSECVPEDPFDCGEETLGKCVDGACSIEWVYSGQPCGTIFKCHTNNP
jgi:hypothetical protein